MIDRSRVIMGCGNFGGVGSLPGLIGRGDDEAQALSLLSHARDCGIFQFDTANTYGGGQSETFLGNWLRQQEPAYVQRVRVSTKVGNAHGSDNGAPPLSAEQIDRHLHKSLKVLRVERLAVYYLHESDPQTPLDETVRALEKACTDGDIDEIGLSNVTCSYLSDFLRTASGLVRERTRYVQNEFNLLAQQDRDDLFAMLVSNGISYVAYSPLAGGLLTGRYRHGQDPPAGSRLSLRPEPYEQMRTAESFQKIEQHLISAREQGRSPAAHAVEFIMATPGVSKVVIGPRKKEHFENLGIEPC